MYRWLSLLSLTTFLGCAHQSPTPPSPTATTPVNASERKPAPGAEPRLCSHFRVHFAFDSSELGAHERAALEKLAACLREDRLLTAAISGNTDERGTEEYNLALGDRRANAVARYLVDLGASSAQLRTVSYGEQDPLCLEHDESCWAANRRAFIAPAETVLDARR